MPLDRMDTVKAAVYVLALLSAALAWMLMTILPAAKQLDFQMKSMERRLTVVEANQRRLYREITGIKKRELDRKKYEK